jgi:hypothetical protein
MRRSLFRPMALFGAAVVMLAAIVAVTLSRATLSASGIGLLKCYDVTGGIEKPCDQPPLIVRTSVRDARLD